MLSLHSPDTVAQDTHKPLSNGRATRVGGHVRFRECIHFRLCRRGSLLRDPALRSVHAVRSAKLGELGLARLPRPTSSRQAHASIDEKPVGFSSGEKTRRHSVSRLPMVQVLVGIRTVDTHTRKKNVILFLSFLFLTYRLPNRFGRRLA